MKYQYRLAFILILAFAHCIYGQIKHQIDFNIKNFGVNVEGVFEESEVSGRIDLQNPANTKLSAIIEVASINTDNKSRDSHLLEADYFDAENHPQISFQSSQFKSKGTDKYEMLGTLTIKGTSKNISIPMVVDRSGATAVLTGELSLNRRDFDVGGGSFILSKTVKIFLTIQIPGS